MSDDAALRASGWEALLWSAWLKTNLIIWNDATRNTLLRDVFSRDTQGAMGEPYTRNRYFHLCLNGQYWGLRQTQERRKSDFAHFYLAAVG